MVKPQCILFKFNGASKQKDSNPDTLNKISGTGTSCKEKFRKKKSN